MTGFSAFIDLSALDGSNGFTINGADAGDNSGYAVSDAGDMNGDGIADFVVSAIKASQSGRPSTGETFVVYGSNNLPSNLNLNTLNGSTGYVIKGIDADDESGISVSSAGDVNNDGFDDLLIGASGGDPNSLIDAGESYVVYGSASTSSILELSDLDGANGYVINGGDAGDAAGGAVSGIGDVNGDGVDDILVGASDADPFVSNPNAGESYVIFGSSSATSSSFELSSLDGTNGYVINGVSGGDASGSVLSGAGDVNGDGLNDFIISADFSSPDGRAQAGESYVVFGSSNSSSSLDLSDLDGTNGFVLKGNDDGDRSGFSVSGAGDVNGDGLDDIVVGAPFGEIGRTENVGESYVVFGSTNSTASLELDSLDGTNGYTIVGVGENDRSGVSVSGAGDINGDGIDDIIIGADYADPDGKSYAGESYVVFGSSQPSSRRLFLTLLDGTNGFKLNGSDAEDFTGASVSGAGDLNGDGVDDVIVGARFADPNGKNASGSSYVVFGQASVPVDGPTAGDDIIYVLDGDNTVDALGGNDTIFAGDGNDALSGGDGNDTVYGKGGDDNIFGNDGDDTLRGELGVDTIDGGLGDDVIDTGAGNDIALGGEGNDILLGYEGDDTLSGGAGSDALFGHDGDDTLSGGEDNDRLYGGTGIDTISGDAGADTLQGGLGNDILNGGSEADTLYGNEDDDTLKGDSGEDLLFGGVGADTLEGGDDDDRLYGGIGDDTISGDAGADTLRGEEGVDTLNGGEGNDVLDGGTGDDTLNGDNGNDSLYGKDGSDTIDGGEGDDGIFGGEGNDIMVGGSGSDRIYGGAGDDTLIGYGVNSSASVAQIDILHGEGGSDTYVLDRMYAGEGDLDYASIRGFSRTDDIIQLSSSGVYTTDSVQNGVGIYDEGDLVAIVEGYVVGGLDLSADYFSRV